MTISQERSEYICEKAKSEKVCITNNERAKFHAFNPNGVLAKKKKLDAEIDKAVEKGWCNPGSANIYGAGATKYEAFICGVARMRRPASDRDITYALNGLTIQIQSATKFLKRISKD